jgi:hypothetical protein
MGKKHLSISLVHAVQMNGNYASNKGLTKNIYYEDHQWNICADLKVDNDWAARMLYKILLFPMCIPSEGEALPWKAMTIPRINDSRSEECSTP